MTTNPINLSDFFDITALPHGDHGLKFTCHSEDLSKMQNKSLPIVLSIGLFGDGTADGGTGREDGYAPRIPDTPLDSEFTQAVEKLQFATNGNIALQGKATLMLDNQKLAILDRQGATIATADAAAVTVMRVYFALLQLKANQRYDLKHRGKDLLTLHTDQDVKIDNLCILYREDAPAGLTRLDGSHYFVLSHNGDDLPGASLTFYVPSDVQSADVYTYDELSAEKWVKLPAPDPKSLLHVKIGENLTFALAGKQQTNG